MVQQNTESLKAAWYYRVKRDGQEELSMRGLVWVGLGSSVSERSFNTVYVWSVSRVVLDSVGQGGGGWDRKGLDVVQ